MSIPRIYNLAGISGGGGGITPVNFKCRAIFTAANSTQYLIGSGVPGGNFTVHYDTDSAWNAGTSQWISPSAGKYLIKVIGHFQSSQLLPATLSNLNIFSYIQPNITGGTGANPTIITGQFPMSLIPNAPGDPFYALTYSGAFTDDLSAGATVDIYFKQFNATPLFTSYSLDVQVWLEIDKVG